MQCIVSVIAWSCREPKGKEKLLKECSPLLMDDGCRGQGLVSLAVATKAVGESSIAWLLTACECSSLVIHCFHRFSTGKL